MRHGSLFSGIGGFDLAAQWMGWENVFQVEIDKFCTKVLEKNFPNVKRYGDIKEFDGTKYRGLIDIISGGVPCQPASVAGKRKGESDDRWLWPEMLRISREIKPPFIVCENPSGIISLGHGKPFNSILSALENEGYQTELFNIPACGLGAWHKRERIWIIAYNASERTGRLRIKNETEGAQDSTKLFRELCGVFPDSRLQRQERPEQQTTGIEQCCEVAPANTASQRGCCGNTKGKYAEDVRELRGSPEHGNWHSEPELGRVANGIPNRVDRLKGLGNAIVPQVAYQIFKAIEQLALSENVV